MGVERRSELGGGECGQTGGRVGWEGDRVGIDRRKSGVEEGESGDRNGGGRGESVDRQDWKGRVEWG